MGSVQHHPSQVGRILLALQFWEGDRARAGELARFITDLERVPHPRADILLSARFDTAADPEVAQYVGRRFNVFTAVGTTRLTGHPAGSFGLWHDTLVAIRDRVRVDPRYVCAFAFEADCVPLALGWIDELLDDWLAHPEYSMAGHEWTAPECPFPHINGNMLISCRAPRLDALIQWRGNPARAWDLEGYRDFQAMGARNTPKIRSIYVRNTPPDFLGRLRRGGASVLHGDKDGSAFRIASERLRSRRPFPEPSSVPFVDADDTVPSVLERLPGRWLDFGVSRVRAPGLIPYASGWLSARSEDRVVTLTRFDAEWNRVSDTEVRGLTGWPDGRVGWHEEPRLVAVGGRVLLSTVRRGRGVRHDARVQCAGWLDVDKSRMAEHLALGFGNNDEHKAEPNEGGWAFFAGPGGALSFVHSVFPLVTVRVDDMRVSRSRKAPSGAWLDNWGSPSSWAPPVQVDESHWVVWFSSWTPHKARHRRYHLGALEFEYAKTGLKVTQFTQRPVASASARDGFWWPNVACCLDPIEVAPSGASFSARCWTLALGVNGFRCAAVRFEHDLLSDAFRVASRA